MLVRNIKDHIQRVSGLVLNWIKRRTKLIDGIIKTLLCYKNYCTPDILLIFSKADLNSDHEGKKTSRFFNDFLFPTVSDNLSLYRMIWDPINSHDVNEIDALKKIHSTSYISSSYLLTWFFLKFVCRPKLVLAFDMRKNFITACRALNITTVESLHGFGISQNHDKYNEKNVLSRKHIN